MIGDINEAAAFPLTAERTPKSAQPYTRADLRRMAEWGEHPYRRMGATVYDLMTRQEATYRLLARIIEAVPQAGERQAPAPAPTTPAWTESRPAPRRPGDPWNICETCPSGCTLNPNAHCSMCQSWYCTDHQAVHESVCWPGGVARPTTADLHAAAHEPVAEWLVNGNPGEWRTCSRCRLTVRGSDQATHAATCWPTVTPEPEAKTTGVRWIPLVEYCHECGEKILGLNGSECTICGEHVHSANYGRLAACRNNHESNCRP